MFNKAMLHVQAQDSDVIIGTCMKLYRIQCQSYGGGGGGGGVLGILTTCTYMHSESTTHLQ